MCRKKSDKIMDKFNQILTKFGLSDKEIEVYKSLLKLGPSPVRKIATLSGVNRGTTYDILKTLKDHGLTSYYHKEKHQYFVAEDPVKLLDVLNRKADYYKNLKVDLQEIIPQVRSTYVGSEERPVVTYYDGIEGIRTILSDVLDKVATTVDKEYFVYSASGIKNYLYAGMPDFNEERITKKIRVKVISLGSGGEIAGLDERRWLTKESGAPTYTIIYAGRVAMISMNKMGLPIGLIIVDNGLFETQRLIFMSLWKLVGEQ